MSKLILCTCFKRDSYSTHVLVKNINKTGQSKLVSYLQDVSLTYPTLDELRVELDTLIAVFQTEIESRQFCVTSSPVTVKFCVFWVPLDGLGVMFNGGCVITFLKNFVSWRNSKWVSSQRILRYSIEITRWIEGDTIKIPRNGFCTNYSSNVPLLFY